MDLAQKAMALTGIASGQAGGQVPFDRHGKAEAF
jgi:hypothetical protein